MNGRVFNNEIEGGKGNNGDFVIFFGVKVFFWMWYLVGRIK